VRNLAAAVVIAALAALAAACSKPQQPKVELAKPLEAAKDLGQDITKKAEERGAAADQAAK
jgi:hypothetical protein